MATTLASGLPIDFITHTNNFVEQGTWAHTHITFAALSPLTVSQVSGWVTFLLPAASSHPRTVTESLGWAWLLDWEVPPKQLLCRVNPKFWLGKALA